MPNYSNKQKTISNKLHAIDNTQKNGIVKLTFVNTVKEAPLVLDSMEYVNPFGEAYRVSTLKYYISNVALQYLKKSFAEPNSYHLIDESNVATASYSFTAPANKYHSISFIIGVDSIKNSSGAQSGALDPTNGMFWTWNSGYIFFKLEGSSPVSTIINHKIQYHIGGYAGVNNALQLVTLQLPAHQLLQVQTQKISEVIITVDINKFWQSASNLKITDTPATMTPGELSKKIAANYSKIFTVKEVLYQ